MRVLITIRKSPAHRYLINLLAKELIAEIKKLVNSNKHSQAVCLAFAKGSLEREVFEGELGAINADLILSETNASWDLTK